jgi:hypothetical protein
VGVGAGAGAAAAAADNANRKGVNLTAAMCRRMESSVREIEDMRGRFWRVQTFLQEVARRHDG